MEISPILQPLVVLLISAVLLPVIDALGKAVKFEKIREIFAVAGFIAVFYTIFNLYQAVMSAENHIIQLSISGFGPPFGVSFVVDSLSVFMAFIFCGLGLLVAIFSIRYMEKDSGLGKYYSLLFTMVAGMVGVVFTGDFFNLFIFWETLCISSYVLVGFRIRQWAPIEAGFKYLVMSTLGSLLVLYAMSLLYGLTGTLNFASIAVLIQASPAAPITLYFILGLIVVGFGISAAIVPFHTWLPDAHPAAPSPISAMLSGVVIKAGIYAIIRILTIVLYPSSIDWTIVILVLAVFAALSMTVGNLMALLQNDIKRLLAFSSVAQMGYIVLAVSVGLFGGAIGLYGLSSGMLHILNHAIMKGLLFLCAGAFIHAVGTRNLSDLTGIAHRMRVTGVLFTVGVLAISGVPPLNGFISELMILIATINAGMVLFAGIMLANVLLGFAYYLRMLYITVWQSPKESMPSVKEAPLTMLIPMVILMLLCIMIGVWPEPFLNFAFHAAEATLNIAGYIGMV